MSVRVRLFEDWIALMRSWGFTVHVAAGAHQRDALPRTAYTPEKMYVEHHDASTALSGNWGALAYILQRNLANIVTARDGQITVCAMGVANHSGVGSRPSLGNVPANGGNYSSFGNEVANNGLGERYSDACTRSIIAGERAWMIVCAQPLSEVRRVLGHKEWADPPGRKTDPLVDMDQRRRDVVAYQPPGAQPAPAPAGKFPIIGAIAAAYNRVVIDRATWAFFIGAPLGPEVPTRDGVGRWQQFKSGAILWHPRIDGGTAHVVWGAILGRFWELGSETVLGYPVSDELACPDTVGRMSHFTGGPHGAASIYWHPATGAHPVWGWFRDAWAAAGWERGALGYPTSAEHLVGGVTTQTFERGQLRLVDGKVVAHPR